ncbi:hypothetical protein [Trichothermofontia sp.]
MDYRRTTAETIVVITEPAHWSSMALVQRSGVMECTAAQGCASDCRTREPMGLSAISLMVTPPSTTPVQRSARRYRLDRDLRTQARSRKDLPEIL